VATALRQKQIVDARGVTTYGFDIDGRLTQVASPEGTVNYEYDPITNRKSKTFTANSETQFTYDELGRLKAVAVA